MTQEKEMKRKRCEEKGRLTKKYPREREAKAKCWQEKLISREGDVQRTGCPEKGAGSEERGVKDGPEEKPCQWKELPKERDANGKLDQEI